MCRARICSNQMASLNAVRRSIRQLAAVAVRRSVAPAAFAPAATAAVAELPQVGDPSQLWLQHLRREMSIRSCCPGLAISPSLIEQQRGSPF